MDGAYSPHSSSAKIKLTASVVAEKNMFLDFHLYDHLKLGNYETILLGFFMTRKGGKYNV